MLGLIFDKKLIFKNNIPLPVPAKDEALIKVLISGICNTDLEIVKGYMGFRGILGHEFVGIVEQCKDKRWIGKRVVGEINIGCNRCSYCKTGLRNHCPDRKVLGILNKDGAFAEYLTLPLKNLHIIPSSISDKEAVFIEPLAACFEVLEQVRIGTSDKVVVLGDGKLGLLMAQVIKTTGCISYLIGKHEEKLSVARSFGIETVLLNEILDGKKLKAGEVAIVVDCTSSHEGLSLAINLTKPKGKIILKSTYASNMPLNLSPVVINEISIIGSRCGPFKKAIDALKRKKIIISPLIYKTFPLKDGLKALEAAGKNSVLKVLLRL
ncbi:MAG: alcohol dehydrogenase [Candidatus Schekmanbacteria bacterium RIFCSPHIGHO2_02_FULL_38_11]|uniref:Alcohol dehydrogenase n=1 Tax=Candidatus Schekmanbacteria bacterium RIFCSPLOWO2_12_FULL_38_15 TaxID=1817883 RepID=A0A1F7SNQ3_9BACT|nr:MAG: alcohol dehydrogenase [Candidatus Schekmanbacteria bacterium RIFCSPLOWO2_02_FULL_38_14]OGL55412.1 MAG: alcohol dehydrogenase [Candidatus Schekmanbacteria bacterium RIFCSPLOWO2_12_FULL_38_15]OGL55673.1 MAG: alcohol dehydrogenase [Candidatus Schekmanbacteria bacterium RIFCSPHIGHO2_02_FULL_38_11]